MASELTIKKASPLGDPHPQFGMTYWCEVEEFNTPVKLNKKTALNPGDKVYGTWEEATSAKGAAYMRFKSEQRPEGFVSGSVSYSKPAGDVLGQKMGNHTISWGEAVIAACIMRGEAPDTDQQLAATAHLARKLHKLELAEQVTIEEKIAEVTEPDYVPDMSETSKINLDDIPF